jgi:hypothetical protein
MKTTTLITFAVLVATVAEAAAKQPEILAHVDVYFSYETSPMMDTIAMIEAQTRAKQLVEQGGIRLNWHYGRLPAGKHGAEAIGIIFVPLAPKDAPSAVLARAYPFATGTAINMFYDRIRFYVEGLVQLERGKVLGHILAHEIVHVLEGVAHHSEEGLMKAKWTQSDSSTMKRGGLALAKEDIEILAMRFRPLVATVQMSPDHTPTATVGFE